VHAHGCPGRASLRVAGDEQQVPGPSGAHAQPLLPQLRPLAATARLVVAWRERPPNWRTIAVMPGNIGLPEILVVLVIALIIFGPKRLPELGRSVGKGIREFRSSISGDDEGSEPPSKHAHIEGAEQ